MKTIKKYWILYRENFAVVLLFQTITFFFGMLLVLIINGTVNQDPDFAALGSFLSMLMVFVLAVCQTGCTSMSLAVGMGQTRRSFLLCDTFMNFMRCIFSMFLCRLFYLLETALYVRLYPGFENGLPLDRVFSLPILGLLVVGIAGMRLLCTMLMVRFGQKAFMIVWIAAWFLLGAASRAVGAVKDGDAGVFAALGKMVLAIAGALPEMGWIWIGCGAALLIAGIGVLGLRRAEIR